MEEGSASVANTEATASVRATHCYDCTIVSVVWEARVVAVTVDAAVEPVLGLGEPVPSYGVPWLGEYDASPLLRTSRILGLAPVTVRMIRRTSSRRSCFSAILAALP